MDKVNEKRRVFDHIANYSEDVMFEDLYESLTPIYDDIKSGRWTDVNIEFTKSDYDDPFIITGYRLETDAEYTERLKREKKHAEDAKKLKAKQEKRKEEKDLKEYERLKKKFEKLNKE